MATVYVYLYVEKMQAKDFVLCLFVFYWEPDCTVLCVPKQKPATITVNTLGVGVTKLTRNHRVRQ